MKKNLARLVVVALLVVGVLGYLGYDYYVGEKDSRLTVSGTIEVTKVELSAKVPGTLGGISVKSGDSLTKDQLVAEIIRNDLEAQKERDSLGVFKAEAQLADLTSGARVQEIKEVSAQVNIALAGLEKAKADYLRGEELLKEGAMTTDQFEKLSTELTIKESQLEAAQAKLNLLQSGSRPEAIRAATIEMERTKAVLKASEALLEDTKIYSPFDGTVLAKNREEGEFVPAGASVVSLANLKDMWIKVYVPTDDLPKVKLGQQVSFTVSGSDASFQGTIEEIATQGEFTPKTIQTKKERTNIVYGVKIRIDDQQGILKPGMPADVTF
ncbi:HlyD family secretion protein [Desulforamulus aquiferis]|uniref:HlyD family efflux transporter periplasmic adaptor subunit n=1 Tax=Desulforamulus aquiferis TaxID=1397668 RepID=A0AAW7ZD64_9FIRM|nr:HlyD family efflux transporter periplasmic adaptor subunit [Desulforamulus aquiferis]MDO7786720.1 HlyD family efflux transporter periplasmic adaptor subunit [Desulforamulus aquiferis]RYD06853.1 hypothetical protein N752_01630 [Desulforamulus aquiferis]